MGKNYKILVLYTFFSSTIIKMQTLEKAKKEKTGGLSMKKFLALLLAVLMVAALAACGSQPTEEPSGADYSNWPEEDIVLYVNSKAGSSGDSLSRQIAAGLEGNEKMNGHQIIVNNIIDGNGTQSWKPVRDADPNGYSLATMSTVIVTAYLLGNSPLQMDDFDWLCGFFVDPQWIVCDANAPYNTFAELMEYVEAHPGEINWGTANAVSSDAIALTQLLHDNPQYEINRVTYNGGGEMLTALLGGFIDVAITEYIDIDANIQAGTLKLLGVMSEERVSTQPEIPTLKEEGFDIVLERARGFAIPKGIDPELKEKMVDLFHDAYDSETFQTWMTQNCVDKRWMTGEEFLASYQNLAQMTEEGLAIINS